MERKRITKALALVLSFLLVVSSVDLRALASEENDGRIISFKSLADSVASQELKAGASESDIVLPDSLQVTVEKEKTVETQKEIEKPEAVPAEKAETIDDVIDEEKSEADEAIESEDKSDKDSDQEKTDEKLDENQEVKVDDSEAIDNSAPVENEQKTEDASAPEEPAPEPQPASEETAEPAPEPEGTDTSFVDILFPAMTVYAAEENEDAAEPLEEPVTEAPAETAEEPAESNSEVEYETVQEVVTTTEETTLENVKWHIDAERSSGESFSSKEAGAKYVYVPEISSAYQVVAAIPAITVTIVPEKEYAIEFTQIVDGVKITLNADAGVFPEGTTLLVRKVTSEEEENVEKAVDEKRADNKNVAASYTFDIKALDKDGNEIEPDTSKGRVKVSFTLEEVKNENLETDVYHVKGEADSLSAEQLNVESEVGETVVAETDGFSYYTVEFTYNNLQYIMNGDSEMPLSEILNTVGLTGTVESAEVSNSELFSVEDRDGQKVVVSHKPFKAQEWLKVTIDGVVYEIVVTDDSDPVTVANWTELKNSSEVSGSTVKLTKNIITTGTLEINENEDVTLDLNDHGITYSNESEKGHVISIPAGKTVTITDTSANPSTRYWSENSVYHYWENPTKGGSGELTTIGGYITGGIGKYENSIYTYNNNNTGNQYVGGGIYNQGTLNFLKGNVVGNHIELNNSGYGGGIFNGGLLTIGQDACVIGNSVYCSAGASSYAAGVMNAYGSTGCENGGKITDNYLSSGGNENNVCAGGGVYTAANFTNTGEISGNTAKKVKSQGVGGGIYCFDGITINNTGDIYNNYASLGAGIRIGASTLNNSGKIYGNTSSDRAGGIFSNGTINLNDGSQITNNVCLGNTEYGTLQADAGGFGGGIFANKGTVNMSGNVTITGNTAKNGAGGIYSASAATINMSGNIQINSNTLTSSGTRHIGPNLLLVKGSNGDATTKLNVTGALTGSNIGFTLGSVASGQESTEYKGRLTAGYISNNTGASLGDFFHIDHKTAGHAQVWGSASSADGTTTNEIWVWAHTHDWKYAVSENVISAWCEGDAPHCANYGTSTSHDDALTITLSADNVAYDGQAHGATASYKSGASTVTKDTITAVTGATIGDITYHKTETAGATTGGTDLGTTAPSDGGNYYASISLTSGGNTYTAVKAFEITVTAGPTYTPPTANNTTYNGSNQALVSGGTATGGTIYYSVDGGAWSSTVPTAKNAKDSYAVSYYVKDDAGSSDIGSESSPIDTINVKIAKKTVTVSGITANNKPYDGTTAATVVTTGATFAGICAGDTLTVSTTGAFDNANAGTGKTVTLGTLTLGGASVANYTLDTAGSQTTATADITPAKLTIKADNASKIAGTTNPEFTYTVTGLVGEDKADDLLTGSLSCSATDSTPVGSTVDITQGTLTIKTGVTNYVIDTFEKGTLTVRALNLEATTLQCGDLDTTSAVLYGTVSPNNDGALLSVAGVGFEYKKASDSSWTTVNSTTGFNFSENLTGLTENTDYQYRAFVTQTGSGEKKYGAVVTFHTKKAEVIATGKISVSVERLDDKDTRDVSVAVEKGNDLIDSKYLGAFSDTNLSLSYDFEHLEDGNYNVVCFTNDGQFKDTQLLTVENGQAARATFKVLPGTLSTVVKVNTADTPKAAVDGLNEILTDEDKEKAANGDEDVEIKLEVEKKDENAEGVADIKKDMTANQKLDMILDLSLFKTIITLENGIATNTNTQNIGGTNTKVLQIAIPYAGVNKKGLFLSRYHGKVANRLEALSSKLSVITDSDDGKYYIDKKAGYIILYASGFSTLAIGYEEESSGGESGGSSGSGGDSGSSSSSSSAAPAVVTPTPTPEVDEVSTPPTVESRVPKTGDNLPSIWLLLLLLTCGLLFTGYAAYDMAEQKRKAHK